MIRQIVIAAELPYDAQSMFRLSINANLIAKGVTAAQARPTYFRGNDAYEEFIDFHGGD